jgi:hypothetical protein
MPSNTTVYSGFDNEYLSRKIAIESEKEERGYSRALCAMFLWVIFLHFLHFL